jgi:hypothetical protein
VIALLALVVQVQSAPAVERAPTVRVRVSPEQPAVGEPITVELRVQAPRGTLVRFPVLPDTGTRIEPLDPRSVTGGETADGVEQVATYRLIAWDTGSVSPAFTDVTVERDGRVMRYPVELGGLRIRSVLPADTAARQPKPAREALDAPTMPWRWWLAAAVVALLAFWGARRARRRIREQATMDPGPLVRARAAFAHLRALDLSSAGEPGRHALSHGAVLRRYIAERWPTLPASLTARELAERLPATDFPVLPERVVSVAAALEPVAYAAAPIASGDAERLALESTTIVEDLERAWVARQLREQESGRIKRKQLR